MSAKRQVFGSGVEPGAGSGIGLSQEACVGGTQYG